MHLMTRTYLLGCTKYNLTMTSPTYDILDFKTIEWQMGIESPRAITSLNLSKSGQGSPRWHDNDIRFLKTMNNERCHLVKGESTFKMYFSC